MELTTVILLIALVAAIILLVAKKDSFNDILNEMLSKTKQKFGDGTGYQILLVVLLVGFAFLLQEVLYNYGERKANMHFTRGLKYSIAFPDTVRFIEFDSANIADYKSKILFKCISLKEGDINYAVVPLPKTRNCKIARIHEQITDVTLKAHNHLLIAKEFMIQSYLCVSAASVFFIIAAACLAYITKSGIANANAYIVIAMVTSAAIGTFFIGLTKIFKHDENVSNNFALYTQHVNLEQRIRNKLVLHPAFIENLNKPCLADTTFTNIILYADGEIQKLNVINLGFDTGSIDYLRTIKALSDEQPANP